MGKRVTETNTDLARKYVLEFLSDGQTHRRDDIVKYVYEKTSGIGVDGEPLPESSVSNVFRLKMQSDIVCPRKGMYALASAYAPQQWANDLRAAVDDDGNPIRFRSSTELVRYWCREFLADGKEHSVAEIGEHVNKMTGGVGVGGERITSSILASGLKQREIENYCPISTRRGWYKMDVINGRVRRNAGTPDLPEIFRQRVSYDLRAILSTARNCLTIDLSGDVVIDDKFLSFLPAAKRVVAAITAIVDELESSSWRGGGQDARDGADEAVDE